MRRDLSILSKIILITFVLFVKTPILTMTESEYAKQFCLTMDDQANGLYPGMVISMFCNRTKYWEDQIFNTTYFSITDSSLSLRARLWIEPLSLCKDMRCVHEIRKWSVLEQLRILRNKNEFPALTLRAKRQNNIVIKQPKILQKLKRKEIRMLNDEERKKLFDALNTLKATKVDDGSISQFDTLISYHVPERARTAHFCPSFLPFHREFIKAAEFALREIDPEISLPYWDLTLDSLLPDPRDSVMWTDELVGTGAGTVLDGPFAKWKPWPDPLTPNDMRFEYLTRTIGRHGRGEIVTKSHLENIMNKTKFAELTFCHDRMLEMTHGFAHLWIGGHMTDFRTAPNDPLFFFFHSFFDYVWETWRLLRQTRRQRKSDYAEGSCMRHCSNSILAPLYPFSTTEYEGLSNWYTDTLYEYEPSPVCNETHSDCANSSFLFCDIKKHLCLPKVRYKGNCTGYDEKVDVCYRSVCINGECLNKTVEKDNESTNAVLQSTTSDEKTQAFGSTALQTHELVNVTVGVEGITIEDVTTDIPQNVNVTLQAIIEEASINETRLDMEVDSTAEDTSSVISIVLSHQNATIISTTTEAEATAAVDLRQIKVTLLMKSKVAQIFSNPHETFLVQFNYTLANGSSLSNLFSVNGRLMTHIVVDKESALYQLKFLVPDQYISSGGFALISGSRMVSCWDRICYKRDNLSICAFISELDGDASDSFRQTLKQNNGLLEWTRHQKYRYVFSCNPNISVYDGDEQESDLNNPFDMDGHSDSLQNNKLITEHDWDEFIDEVAAATDDSSENMFSSNAFATTTELDEITTISPPVDAIPFENDETATTQSLISNLDHHTTTIVTPSSSSFLAVDHLISATGSSIFASSQKSINTMAIFPNEKQIEMHLPSSLNFVPQSLQEDTAVIKDECKNLHDDCEYWATHNECKKNPLWMHHFCALSCDRC